MTNDYIHHPERLRDLYHYNVLDTEPEEPFDRIADLAAHVFDAPVAMVSLIDDKRQWQKACVGFDAPELDLDTSFCTHTIQSDDVLVVENASRHPVFEDNPFVTGGPEVRFYAGAPLITPRGHRIGTLCVFDMTPRSPGEAVVQQLESMAAMVVDELELRNRVRVEREEHQATKERARRKLEREREFLRKLFATIPVMIAVHRPDEDRVRVNAAFQETLLGDDVSSDAAGDLLDADEQAPGIRERVDRLFDEVDNGWEDVVVEAPDGTEVVGAWSTLVLSDDTRVAIGIDRTKRRQLEAQLRHAQKMETVGTLAGGIAHDFNNILHAATIYLEMALERVGEDASLRDVLEPIDRGLQRAEMLVDQLLTFSRQETAVSNEEVHLDEIVEETLTLADPSIPSCVSVETSFRPTSPVMGDPGQIQQVVLNLVTNAAQAMEALYEEEQSGGAASTHVLELSLRMVQVDAQMAAAQTGLAEGQYVCFSVSDTGPGIEPDTRERIFEPFYTTKDVGKGTGLGLSVVHGIVQSHGGEITLFTQPGMGTTFNFYLPAVGTPPPEPSRLADTEAPSTASEPGTVSILLVDDDRQDVVLEQQRLEQLGYTATTCHRGDEAMDEVLSGDRAFDLVLTDYAMPGMNGLELTQALRDEGFTQPIILTSRFGAQVSREEALDMGVTAFLRKPIGREELKQTIEAHRP